MGAVPNQVSCGRVGEREAGDVRCTAGWLNVAGENIEHSGLGQKQGEKGDGERRCDKKRL